MKVNVGDFRLSPEEKAAVLDVLDSNRITEGKKVSEFENQFSQYIGVEDTVLLNSGTSALITGLNAIRYINPEIKPARRVITTPITYISTPNAVLLSGLKPIFVDVDPLTFNITPETIQIYLEQIDDPSVCSMILPVHLMGYPVDMDGVNKIAKKYNLTVFEDSAQAHGSLYKGKRCGSMSVASAFSFYIAHNIQVGEMGALVTKNKEVAAFSRRFKANGRMCDCKICTRSRGYCPRLKDNPGVDPRFYHLHIGYNFKTTDLMAAIGLEQLKHAEEIRKKRYENVEYLTDQLSFLEDKIQLPLLSEDVSYLAYPLVVKNSELIREKVTRQLEEKGIETRPLFSCIPLQQPAYNQYKSKYIGKLPNAEYIGNNGFYIGCHQYLQKEELDYVIDIFKKIHAEW